MLHTKQASDLLQDLFPTLAFMSYALCQVWNKSCSRSKACFVCNINYCYDHDIVSNMAVANASE